MAVLIRCNFIHIILMECNADMSQRDIPAMEKLMKLCLDGDIEALQTLAASSTPSRAASAARFILRKHNFEVQRQQACALQAA